MRLTLPAAGVIAAAALTVIPVTADAATPSTPILSSSSPCAAPGGFAQVQPGQTLQQVQREMGSAGNANDTTAQGGFVREEVTWRDCSTVTGRLGALDLGVLFYATPTQPLTVSSKSQLVLGTIDG